jgi:hypothetical protein
MMIKVVALNKILDTSNSNADPMKNMLLHLIIGVIKVGKALGISEAVSILLVPRHCLGVLGVA